MSRLFIILILNVGLSATVFGQTSLSESTGFWSLGSTWTGGTMPGAQSGGTITATSSIVVIDGTVKVLNNLVLNLSNLSINAGDTLVILGDLTEAGSLISNDGVLIVFGNVSNTGSTNFISGSGKMVVTGDYANSFGANFFVGPSYVYGSTSGFFSPPAVGDESDLQTNDPDLYNYVQNTYAALPVELLYFSVKMAGRNVELTWATATEHNNDYFIVERSADGIHFDLLQTMDAAGNSNVKISYSMLDSQPLSRRSYYRLGQVDYDGKLSHLEIVTVFNDDASIEIYPNPTVDLLYFSRPCMGCTITLSDSHGRFAPRNIEVTEMDNGRSGVNLNGIDSGVYFVLLTDPESSLTAKYRIVKK